MKRLQIDSFDRCEVIEEYGRTWIVYTHAITSVPIEGFSTFFRIKVEADLCNALFWIRSNDEGVSEDFRKVLYTEVETPPRES